MQVVYYYYYHHHQTKCMKSEIMYAAFVKLGKLENNIWYVLVSFIEKYTSILVLYNKHYNFYKLSKLYRIMD